MADDSEIELPAVSFDGATLVATYGGGDDEDGVIEHEWIYWRRIIPELASKGEFDKVIEIIWENDASGFFFLTNSWRLRKNHELATNPPTCWTILHQAAMSPQITPAQISRILELGAFKRLKTLDTDQTAYEIALDYEQPEEILELLKPNEMGEEVKERFKGLQMGLEEIIHMRAANLVKRHMLRLPQIDILRDLPGKRIWFDVPQMYGGFSIRLRGKGLEVGSWCRVVGGSGMRHFVTGDGKWILEEEGFV